MLNKITPPRPQIARTHECRDYQRLWNGYCVDKNLKNEWLERLNDLKVFDLISICEGHTEERGNKNPHINLRLREKYIDDLNISWSKIINPLSLIIQKYDQHNSRIEIIKMIAFKNHAFSNPKEILTVKLNSKIVRTINRLPVDINNWFEDSIIRLSEIDELMHSFI